MQKNIGCYDPREPAGRVSDLSPDRLLERAGMLQYTLSHIYKRFKSRQSIGRRELVDHL
jgi:hypothetical protein